MPETTPTPAPTPAPKKRAPAGFLEQDLEDALELAEDCQREAEKADVTPLLTEREWTAEKQGLLTASLERCDATIDQLRTKRTVKRSRTDEEEAARTELLVALEPVIKGARRQYPDGSPQRKAYGIGARLSSASTKTLFDAAVYTHGQLSPGENNAAPKDKLPGVLPTEIAVVSALADKYKNADWAQGDAQKDASKLLATLRLEIETVLNPLRRDLQGAADQAFTHRNPVNAAQRKAFGLQPDRSLNT